ncbi:exodeoxyribonuclease VII large subunit [Methanorbis rubei]|uniref:Exodeoxyribonuclease 7 large subunit n=1 Tax=Methanorbis rubei TaxID=3028300 RepID=A0AAE4MFG0_9EURY|nr:Exodeoxyribonuclease 7 large subunit [Methanocorpusculaceae archaeon Cs1]
MAGKGQQTQLTFDTAETDCPTSNIIAPVKENSTLDANVQEVKEPKEPAVLSVSELAERIRDVIDTPLLTNVCVQGEITGYRPHSSGHLYFSLSEHGDESATMPCVMWKYAAKTVAFPVKDGALVQATGYVDFYPPYGKMQFVIKKLEPAISGKTGLYLLKEQWKKQLTDEGTIPRSEAARRCPPLFPTTIGVVTSRTGAVLQDIRNVIGRRYPLKILLAHTAVQGDGAHLQIAAAIASLQGKADVIIVARGGGSFEDLFEFNHPDVVRAIAGSAVPVISAIGHETDTTLADFAADRRVPTPSAAAETVVPDRTVLLQQLEEMRRAIRDNLTERFSNEKTTLSELRGRVDPIRLARKLDQMLQQTADFAERITTALSRRISSERETCKTLKETIARLTRTKISTARLELLAQKEVIQGRNPYKPLELGYALVWKEGKLIRTAANINDCDQLSLQLVDGEVTAVVEKIRYDRNTTEPNL